MTWTMFRLHAIATALGAMALGCEIGSAPVVEEVGGELGHGTFRWSCDSDADPTCGTGQFPLQVAVGSTFGLSFTLSDDLPEETEFSHLASASPRRLGDDGGFSALVPGEVTVIAFGPDYAIDVVTLSLQEVDGLQLSTAEPANEPEPDYDCNFLYCTEVDTPMPAAGGPVALVVGQPLEIQALPLHAGSVLAGTLTYAWESTTPDGLVVTPQAGRRARLDPRLEGDVQLVVTAGGISQTFDLHVEPAPADPQRQPPAAGDTGGSDDGGSSGGTGGSTGGSDDGLGSDGSGAGSDSGGTQ